VRSEARDIHIEGGLPSDCAGTSVSQELIGIPTALWVAEGERVAIQGSEDGSAPADQATRCGKR